MRRKGKTVEHPAQFNIFRRRERGSARSDFTVIGWDGRGSVLSERFPPTEGASGAPTSLVRPAGSGDGRFDATVRRQRLGGNGAPAFNSSQTNGRTGTMPPLTGEVASVFRSSSTDGKACPYSIPSPADGEGDAGGFRPHFFVSFYPEKG